MSSILKALKKLEREKSGRFPESMDLDLDILRSTDSSRSYSPLALVLLFLMIFGGGAAVAYLFMKGTKVPQATTKSHAAMTSKDLPPQIFPSVIKPEALPVEIVVVPARKEPSDEVSRKESQKTAVAYKVDDSAVKKSAVGAVSVISEKPKETPGTVKKGLPADTTVPALRVNGIAFQNGNTDSLAMVNGMPVSSGSVIEGITVKKIREDRVLFQHNGATFEILLGQSNR